MAGRNPMRWDCEKQGCFNKVKRPKIEEFADSLPGKRKFTDIDATTDVNGNFLFMEFKGGVNRELPTGQAIYLRRLTALSKKITAVVVFGNAETMKVDAIMVVERGNVGELEACSLAQLKARIKGWAKLHG